MGFCGPRGCEALLPRVPQCTGHPGQNTHRSDLAMDVTMRRQAGENVHTRTIAMSVVRLLAPPFLSEPVSFDPRAHSLGTSSLARCVQQNSSRNPAFSQGTGRSQPCEPEALRIILIFLCMYFSPGPSCCRPHLGATLAQ